MFQKLYIVGLVALACVVGIAPGIAHAAAWGMPFAVTSDATSGISSSNTYTHAINFGGSSLTINGVAFTPETLGSNTGDGEFNGTNYNGWGDVHQGTTTATATGNVNGLLSTFFRGDWNFAETGNHRAQLDISGLTPDTTYTATFYGITGGSNPVSLRAQQWVEGEFGQEEQTVNTSWDQGAFGSDVGSAVSITYTTYASGNGSTSMHFEFSTNDADYRFTGFTNIVGTGAAETPEPGTLAILLTGAVGLLAYAWRTRK